MNNKYSKKDSFSSLFLEERAHNKVLFPGIIKKGRFAKTRKLLLCHVKALYLMLKCGIVMDFVIFCQARRTNWKMNYVINWKVASFSW